MSHQFHVENLDGISLVHFDDIQVLPDARDRLYDLAGHDRLVLDLRGVGYISSYALSILASLQKKVAAAGGRLRLCGLGPDVLDLFRITHLDRVFDIYGSEQEALRDF